MICAPTTTAVLTSAISEGANTNDLLAQAASFIPTTYLDAKGIFTAIIVSIGCVEIMRVMLKKNIRFKMPEGVPPAIASSFDSILPLFVCMGVFYGVSLIIQNISGELLPSLIMTILAPAISGLDSLLGICLITIIAQTFWFFGLHGSNIMAPIINALLLPLTILNTEAFANGKPAEYILNSQFIDSYVNMGGSGTTIALLIAILIIAKRKSAQQKMMVGLGIAPGCFNINEPVIFGMPIILNPIYFVPFILAPMACTVIAYALTAIGFAPKVVVMAGWTTPPILGAILSTNSIRGGITALICLAAAVVIYLPFVAMAAKQENAAANKVENQVTV